MKFDQKQAQAALAALHAVNVARLSVDERMALIELIWQVPHLVHAYRERCLENGASESEYNRFMVDLTDVVQKHMRELTRPLS